MTVKKKLQTIQRERGGGGTHPQTKINCALSRGTNMSLRRRLPSSSHCPLPYYEQCILQTIHLDLEKRSLSILAFFINKKQKDSVLDLSQNVPVLPLT